MFVAEVLARPLLAVERRVIYLPVAGDADVDNCGGWVIEALGPLLLSRFTGHLLMLKEYLNHDIRKHTHLLAHFGADGHL